MNNYLIAIILVLLLSCNSTKTSTQAKKQSNEQASINLYRFNVSFISIGSGIDNKAKQQFLEFVKKYEMSNKIRIFYEVGNWGREGETDYCLKMTELKPNEQDKFIFETKKLLGNNKLVRFNENTTCKYKSN